MMFEEIDAMDGLYLLHPMSFYELVLWVVRKGLEPPPPTVPVPDEND